MQLTKNNAIVTRDGFRDLQKEEYSVAAPMVEKFRFQVVLKGQNKVRNYKFLTKIF